MCAIAGLASASTSTDELLRVLDDMLDAQSFRGPDGRGSWAAAGVALGNVRLSIQGSASGGAQPLRDRWGGRLVFNGEIYDPAEVMASLGETFACGDSDGTALNAVLHARGPSGLRDLHGMFALARGDASGTLLLARDTWGQKPLYYARWRDGWAFASTIAAIHAAIGPLTLRREAAFEYLVYKSVGGMSTSFSEISQVPPGAWIRLLPDGRMEQGRYASVPEPTRGVQPVEVRATVDRAVRIRGSHEFLNALFLSGGADSAIVAASLARQGHDLRLKAFSIGYDVAGNEDETHYARALADTLGIDHEIVRLHAVDVPRYLEEAAAFTEDPIADPVTLPTLLLARHVARETKVALTGDGSDEFWGGYERFASLPATLPAYLARTMVFSPAELGLESAPASYLDGIELPDGDLPMLDRVLRLEAANRLRNYHLARIDKLGMAAALELRSPFLDAHVTRLANCAPGTCKRANGVPKGLLLDAFSADLPRWMIDRKKQPFTMPVVAWLSDALREYARDTLLARDAWIRGFVDPALYLEAFEAGHSAPLAARIWSLLQLEAWHRVWKEKLA